MSKEAGVLATSPAIPPAQATVRAVITPILNAPAGPVVIRVAAPVVIQKSTPVIASTRITPKNAENVSLERMVIALVATTALNSALVEIPVTSQSAQKVAVDRIRVHAKEITLPMEANSLSGS